MKFSRTDHKVDRVKEIEEKSHIKDEDGSLVELKNSDVKDMVIDSDKGHKSFIESPQHDAVSGDIEVPTTEESLETLSDDFFENVDDMVDVIQDRFEDMSERFNSMRSSTLESVDSQDSFFESNNEIETPSISVNDYYHSDDNSESNYDISEDIVETREVEDNIANIDQDMIVNDSVTLDNDPVVVDEPILQRKNDHSSIDFEDESIFEEPLDIVEDNSDVVIAHDEDNYIVDEEDIKIELKDDEESLEEQQEPEEEIEKAEEETLDEETDVIEPLEQENHAPDINMIEANSGAESNSKETFVISNIDLSDEDSSTLEGASIALVNYQDGDSINIENLPDGIEASIVGSSIELTGLASVSDYETALKSLSFQTTSDDNSNREFVFSVFDGNKYSEAHSINLEIHNENTVSNVLVEEDFEDGAVGWTDNTTTDLGGDLTQFLGRFGGTNGEEGVSKTYNLGIENAGKTVTLEFDMYELDSWDGSNDFNRISEGGKTEAFQVFVNGSKVADDEYDAFTADEIGNAKDDSDGGIQVDNLSYDENGGWAEKDYERANNEEIHHYTIQAQVDENGEITLGFGSTLNQEISDESFGIDNIKISYSDNAEGNIDPIAVSDKAVFIENHEVVFDSNYINVWGNPIEQDNFTISLEITPNIIEDGFKGICGIQVGDDVDGRSPSLYQVGNKIKYDSVDEDGNHYTEYIDATLEEGQSTHITWVKDGTEYRFYQDGVLIHTSEAPEVVAVNDNYYFGEVSGSTFDGSMDNIQVYSKALTSGEVMMVSQGEVIDGSSLNLYYDFEGDNPWSDKSGNDFNAHPVGDSKPEIISKDEHFDIQTVSDESIKIDASRLLANDLDIDGDAIYIVDVNKTQNTYGTVSLDANGDIIYTPDGSYVGIASFEYTISDGKGGTSTANVNVNVTSRFTESQQSNDEDILVDEAQDLHFRNVEYHSDTQNDTDYDDYIDADLSTGNSDDTVIVEDDVGDSDYLDLDSHSSIEDGAKVDTGAGDDEISISDVSSGFDDGKVSLGEGNDNLIIDDTLSGTEVVFDGGEGKDSLVLNNVNREDWDNGVKDNFENFEHVTLNGESDENDLDIDSDAVFDMSDGMNFDFSDENLESLNDIQQIDMKNDSADAIEAITLDDILEMTDENNTLTITGDDNDTLDINTDGWTQNGPVVTDTSTGMTTYEYSNGSGDIITLNIDEQIHSTGM